MKLTDVAVAGEPIKQSIMVQRLEINFSEETKEFLLKALQAEPVKTLKQTPEACKNCSNHPSNGGSGICFCTLGSVQVRF